jgi:para-nitrobenzyl esterase
MVFIHGGGYYEGSSRDFSGEGEGFVRTGRVVFVSFNYRLGALGYLDFTPWSTPARPIEGNLGLRDQVAALQWVRNNIRAFGGDPDRITVFGESAGGNAVTTLLAVPSARDLFARAIAQSAPANAVYPATLAERWAGEFLAILGEGAANGRGRRDDSDRRGLPRLRELRDLPGLRGFPGLRDLSGRRGLRELGSLGGLRAAVEGPEPADQKAAAPGTSSQAVLQRLLNGTVTELLVAAHVLQARTPEAYPGAYCFAPGVDGSFLPEPPIEAIRTGRAAPVPLIIGTNEREGTIFRGRMDILPGSATRIDALFERAPAGTRKRMRDAYPGLPHWRPASDFGGDYGFWYPTTRVAAFHSRFAPVHVYRFDLAPRLLRLVGLDATHGVEMFTLFDRTAVPLARTMTALGGREEYARAGRRMRSRWLRFAESGTTTASWPAYTERTRATLIIDDDDRIQLDPHRDRRIAWNGFLPDLGNPPSAPGPGEGEAGT